MSVFLIEFTCCVIILLAYGRIHRVLLHSINSISVIKPTLKTEYRLNYIGNLRNFQFADNKTFFNFIGLRIDLDLINHCT